MKAIVKAGLCGAGAVALLAGGLSPAFADPAPLGTNANTGDIVGVGSDTVQYGDDFVADGNALTPGYNSFNPAHRIATFDATNPYILKTGTLVGITGDLIKLRSAGGTGTTGANANIIARPNGSGPGLNLVNAGATSNAKIDFARASRPLAAGTETTNLDQHLFADDEIQVAVAHSGTNAPSAITTDVLRRIYEPQTAGDAITKWNQIPGNESGSGATIVPMLPQTGSGTRNTFLTDLFGTSTPASLNTTILTTEEHDPTNFVTPPSGVSAANEIAPFSTARQQLQDTGYFNYLSPNFVNSVTLLPGVGTGTNDNYENTRHLYNVTRKAAASQSWVSSAFGPSGFFCSGSGQSLAQAAGLDPLSGGVTCGNAS